MDTDKKAANEKAALGLIPMLLMVVSACSCLYIDKWVATGLFAVAVGLLGYGILSGKVKLFG